MAIHTVLSGQLIQAAIDAAVSGDTIQLYPGRYSESIVLDKPVTLIGKKNRRGKGPVLQAGTRLTGWTLNSGSDDAWFDVSNDYQLGQSLSGLTPPVGFESSTVQDSAQIGVLIGRARQIIGPTGRKTSL